MADNKQSYPLVEFEGLLNKPAINFQEFSKAPNEELSLLEDLQAGILKHHKRNFACHLFIRFSRNSYKHISHASEWLSDLDISSAKEQLTQRKANNWKNFIRCFYLSRSGYRYFKIKHLAPKKCSAFGKGLTSKITSTFDTVRSELFYNKRSKIQYDAILLLAHDDVDQLLEEVNRVSLEIKSFTNTIKHQYGFLKGPKNTSKDEKKNLTEWFGFKDGVSGPHFFSSSSQPIPNRTIPNLKSIITRDPGGMYKQSAGSYLVFLKMSQDYEAFKSLRENISLHIDKPIHKKTSYREELAEAYIVGRFTDGTPVTLKDEEREKLFDSKGNPVDEKSFYDFNFKEIIKDSESNTSLDDALGFRCPYHAHIRKVNLRTKRSPYDDLTIHRRGMLYAEGVDTKEKLLSIKSRARTKILEEDQTEVGILFLSFQSHIEQQFEFMVQRRLHRDTYLPDGRKSGKDILTAKAGKDEFYIPAKWNNNDNDNLKPVKNSNSLSQLLGGDYFFAPSISLLRRIKGEVQKTLVKSTPLPQMITIERDEKTGAMIIRQVLDKKGIPSPDRGKSKIFFSEEYGESKIIIRKPTLRRVERDPDTGAMKIFNPRKNITFNRKL